MGLLLTIVVELHYKQLKKAAIHMLSRRCSRRVRASKLSIIGVGRK